MEDNLKFNIGEFGISSNENASILSSGNEIFTVLEADDVHGTSAELSADTSNVNAQLSGTVSAVSDFDNDIPQDIVVEVEPSPANNFATLAVDLPDVYIPVQGVLGATTLVGKSAYEIAVEHGFIGTEEEWLESIKGYTPIRGIDYWTDEDVQTIENDLKDVFNEQLTIATDSAEAAQFAAGLAKTSEEIAVHSASVALDAAGSAVNIENRVNGKLDLMDASLAQAQRYTNTASQKSLEASQYAAQARESASQAQSVVAQVQSALNEHIADNVRHITQQERENWNDKPDVTMNDLVIGDIVYNGSQRVVIPVYSPDDDENFVEYFGPESKASEEYKMVIEQNDYKMTLSEGV